MVSEYAKLGAKAIEKTVTEIGREQQKFGSVPEEGSPFKQMLDSLYTAEDLVANLGMNSQAIGLPSYDVKAISADGISVDIEKMGLGLGEPNGMEKVVGLLSEVNNGQMQMENLVNQILYSGKRFTNQELLAIQAHVFHFAQVTEIVVKAADQGVSSIKAILNTNIQ